MNEVKYNAVIHFLFLISEYKDPVFGTDCDYPKETSIFSSIPIRKLWNCKKLRHDCFVGYF